MEGYQYRCIVSSSCGSQDTTSSATLHVSTSPHITVQPSKSVTCNATNGYFSLTATGTSLTYQWQENQGSGWNNLTNNSTYSNVTTNALTVAAVTSMNRYAYRCVITGGCTPPVTSDSVILKVHTTGTWIGGNSTKWTDAANWCGGVPASASNVTITSDASTMPQTDSTITTNDVTVESGASVTLVQNLQVNGSLNLNGSILLNGDTLIINGPITGGGSLAGGTTSNILVNGTGATTSLPSVTTNSLTINRASGISMTGDVTVTGTLTLTSGTLTVGSNTLTIDSTVVGNVSNLVTTSASSLALGGTHSFTTPSSITSLNIISVNNTSDSGVSLGNSLNLSGGVIFSSGLLNLGNDNLTLASGATVTGFDSTKYIVTKNSLTSGGTLKQYVRNDSSYVQYPIGTSSKYAPLQILLSSGSTSDTFSIRVANRIMKNGTNGAALTSHTVNKTWFINESTSGGSNATVKAGWLATDENSGFTRTKACVAHYNGTKWDTGKYSSATFTSNTYWQVRTNVTSFSPYGVLDSDALLTPITLTSSPKNDTICSGHNASFSVTATGSGRTYQWQESPDTGRTWHNLTNGGIYASTTDTTLLLSSPTVGMSGYEYHCIVSGTLLPADTTAAAKLIIHAAPSISLQPSSATICPNASTTMTITASGYSIGYQWQESTDGGSTYHTLSNAGVYSGVTTNTLSFTSAPNSMNGYKYECVVTGTCSPAVTSSAATLIFNTAPSISVGPSSVSKSAGTNTSFSVTASGTGISYQWQESRNSGSTFSNLSNGGVYSTVTTNSLTLTGVTSGMTGYEYRCVVGGTCTPSATSGAGTLTVTNSAVNLSAKVFLQGPYSGGTMTTTLNSKGKIPLHQPYWSSPWSYHGTETVASIPNANVVDWVLVELRSSNSTSGATSTLARRAGFLLKTGTIVDVDGSSALKFDTSSLVSGHTYFIVVRHRNHLGVVTNIAQTFTAGATTSFDFTSAATQSRGSAVVQVATGVYAMYASDGNNDNKVNNVDANNIWFPQSGLINGYYLGDFNLDTKVNNVDVNNFYNIEPSPIGKVVN